MLLPGLVMSSEPGGMPSFLRPSLASPAILQPTQLSASLTQSHPSCLARNMASQSNQGSQVGNDHKTTYQTRSQTQENAGPTAAGENMKPDARYFVAKGPQIPKG
ncbi:hypothetical protein I7I51_09083 [Histoplasma capsulatum]|uniref:Uncharacterized protein n=1 Tax=Ajellomyces capsulatus TaxID=5037 RepID=A0A8A1M639_AJECA|nr:hypothetical protein I7I51_09083 [Histoplasma capsulatum]